MSSNWCETCSSTNKSCLNFSARSRCLAASTCASSARCCCCATCSTKSCRSFSKLAIKSRCAASFLLMSSIFACASSVSSVLRAACVSAALVLVMCSVKDVRRLQTSSSALFALHVSSAKSSSNLTIVSSSCVSRMSLDVLPSTISSLSSASRKAASARDVLHTCSANAACWSSSSARSVLTSVSLRVRLSATSCCWLSALCCACSVCCIAAIAAACSARSFFSADSWRCSCSFSFARSSRSFSFPLRAAPMACTFSASSPCSLWASRVSSRAFAN